jgi:hypothetical protein
LLAISFEIILLFKFSLLYAIAAVGATSLFTILVNKFNFSLIIF